MLCKSCDSVRHIATASGFQGVRVCAVLQVTSCHVNPVNSNLLMTSSNDWTAKIFDMRKMSTSIQPDNGKGADPLRHADSQWPLVYHHVYKKQHVHALEGRFRTIEECSPVCC